MGSGSSRVLASHSTAVVSEVALERWRSGKISEQTVHATGLPYEEGAWRREEKRGEERFESGGAPPAVRKGEDEDARREQDGHAHALRAGRA